ncbi:hypothetical protein EVAR_88856_1 [Eumeta japonica]|uniref:Uncharacterized protein n=1 Tax=Eumeta variegata TaxID=151549 RepID=A0A4C1Y3B3_EUMVA|nr:hypothetical protein EVAR_88856_1 [Eumeta japonica]
MRRDFVKLTSSKTAEIYGVFVARDILRWSAPIKLSQTENVNNMAADCGNTISIGPIRRREQHPEII